MSRNGVLFTDALFTDLRRNKDFHWLNISARVSKKKKFEM